MLLTIGGFILGALTTLAASALVQRYRAGLFRPGWPFWLALVFWYFWTVFGISFVSINLAGNHAQAAGLGAFLFLGVALLAGLFLARMVLRPAKPSPKARLSG